jgi:hypothetical protein
MSWPRFSKLNLLAPLSNIAYTPNIWEDGLVSVVHPLSEYLAYIPIIHPTSSKGWVEFSAGYVVFLLKSEY